MKEVRKSNTPVADAAKEAALMLLCDPLALICTVVVFARSWEGGLAILALYACTVSFVVLVTWLKHRDTQ